MTGPGFGPLDIPGGSGPSLDSDKPWYKRWFLWLLAAGVAVGAILFQLLA